MGIRHKQAALNRRQREFVEAYARDPNGAAAARAAGYSTKTAREIAHSNLSKSHIKTAVDLAVARLREEITPNRVKRRLDQISHNAESAGQFGPAVRAEELLGKSIGMWIDQSLHLTGVMNDTHIAALLELARKRSTETVDNADRDDD